MIRRTTHTLFNLAAFTAGLGWSAWLIGTGHVAGLDGLLIANAGMIATAVFGLRLLGGSSGRTLSISP